jgi:hypothetical protein
VLLAPTQARNPNEAPPITVSTPDLLLDLVNKAVIRLAPFKRLHSEMYQSHNQSDQHRNKEKCDE